MQKPNKRKVIFSRGSRGEEPEIPKGQAQGEIACCGIVAGMETC